MTGFVSRREFLAAGPTSLALTALGYGLAPGGAPPAVARPRAFWTEQPGWWKLSFGWLPDTGTGSSAYASLWQSGDGRWTVWFCATSHTFEAACLAQAQRHAECQLVGWLRSVLVELERQAFRSP